MKISNVYSTFGSELVLSDGTIFRGTITAPGTEDLSRGLLRNRPKLIVASDGYNPPVGESCTDPFGRTYLIADDGQDQMFRQYVLVEADYSISWVSKSDGTLDPVTKLPKTVLSQSKTILGTYEPDGSVEGRLNISAEEWIVITNTEVGVNDYLDGKTVKSVDNRLGLYFVMVTDGK